MKHRKGGLLSCLEVASVLSEMNSTLALNNANYARKILQID